MESTRRVVLAAGLAIGGGALLLLATVGLADDDHLEARRLMETDSILPLESILDRVQAQRPGRILEVELEREDGRYVYEIELLDESGQVWELELDAVTGETLEQELEE